MLEVAQVKSSMGSGSVFVFVRHQPGDAVAFLWIRVNGDVFPNDVLQGAKL